MRSDLAAWCDRHKQTAYDPDGEDRRRLAALAYPLGRTRLQEVAAIATPDTLLRWYRRLIAEKFDGSTRRQQLGRPRVGEEIDRRDRMRRCRGISGWLPLVLLTACVAAPPRTYQSGTARPAVDRFLSRGDIKVAQMHLQAFGFDPGPIDGIYTAETQAAVRAYQSTYGLGVSGLLDRQTREQLKVGPDSRRGD